MHWIIGLGNPGHEYKQTRHNVGFDVVDELAENLDVAFEAGHGDYVVAFGSFKNNEIALAKPTTYMNNVGEAVLDIRNRYDVPLERFLIICDDFQLPLGQLRLRPGGSDGGHNGLYSIIYHLKSNSFPRLRCGIASESLPIEKNLLSRFVLHSFTKEERAGVKEMVAFAVQASLTCVVDGIEKAMNKYNMKISSTNNEDH